MISGLLPQDGQITNYILAVNLFIYMAMAIFNQENINGGGFSSMNGVTLFLFGAKEPGYIFHGEWWRLVTAGFLHASLIHIGMNSWSLYNLGPQVEEAFGAGRMLVIYLASSTLGFLASTLFSPSLSVGASAGIFGLVGAMIAFGIHQRGAFGSYIKSAYIGTAVISLLMTSFISQIDNFAHLGGLAGGFGAAYIVGHPRFAQARQERYWSIAGLAMAGIVVVCFVIQLLATLKYLRS